MASCALSSSMLSNPSILRLGSTLASSNGEHFGKEDGFWHYSRQHVRKENPQGHAISAVLSETITEAAPVELSKDENKQIKNQTRGRGGRNPPRVRQKGEAKVDMSQPSKGPKLGWLKNEGIDLNSQLTLSRINRIIGLCPSVTEALGVIEEMKAAGLTTANEGTYLALITVCRRQQQGDRALSILQAMKQAGVKPGMLTYNTLISCCQQSLRLEDGLRIKEEMEAAEVKPDAVTYTSLMALILKASPYRGRASPAQRMDKIMEMYNEMLGCNVQPDVVTYNTMMYAGAQAKLPGKVLEVYQMMIAAGVSPNQFTFTLLLESVGSGGRLKSALQVFNEMKAAGLPARANEYNFVIAACAAAPQPDAAKAWELFEEMKNTADVTPNAETFTYLIAATSKGGDHPGAIKAYEEMIEKGHSKYKTTSTFNKLIHSASMAEGLESGFKMYEKMLGEGVKPDVYTYSTLLSACARYNDLERALAIGEEFEKLGIRPNQVALHALIGAFGKADRWQDAIATFRNLEKGEEPPTVVSYSIVFSACFGKDGLDGFLAAETLIGDDYPPGIEAAIELYHEAVTAGLFQNFKQNDLTRCDVRRNGRAAIAISLLAWLKAVRKSPPLTDLVVVVGTVQASKGKEPVKPRKGKSTWKFGIAQRTLQYVGLKSEEMSTITMQAQTVRSQTLKTWLTNGHSTVENVEAASIA